MSEWRAFRAPDVADLKFEVSTFLEPRSICFVSMPEDDDQRLEFDGLGLFEKIRWLADHDRLVLIRNIGT